MGRTPAADRCLAVSGLWRGGELSRLLHRFRGTVSNVVPVVTEFLDRRSFLKVGAAAAGVPAVRGLPAWARPLASAATGLRRPDSLPFPDRAAGTPDPGLGEIEHVIVLMMENHSFDNILGMVPHQVSGRSQVDGLTVHNGRVANWNPDATGAKVFGSLAPSPCQSNILAV